MFLACFFYVLYDENQCFALKNFNKTAYQTPQLPVLDLLKQTEKWEGMEYLVNNLTDWLKFILKPNFYLPLSPEKNGI